MHRHCDLEVKDNFLLTSYLPKGISSHIILFYDYSRQEVAARHVFFTAQRVKSKSVQN